MCCDLSQGCEKTAVASMKFLRLQSADVDMKTSEVLTFEDNDAGDIDDVGYSPNPIASASVTQKTDLATFLSRPTIINTHTWTTSESVGFDATTIEPWFIFMNNSVIKRKLENYAFIRAKLCLKFVINATPFHFGLYLASYEPSVNAADTGFRKSKIRTNALTSNPYIIPLSQLPHAYLRPAANAGGEIHIPFFLHKSYLTISSAAEARSMGVLRYYIASPLGVASSSASTTVTIDTFAWLEDVELSGSTTRLALQARDEYDGPISKPASAIARIASRLSDAPVIGKFARATEIGASAVAGIAGIFGFTNTPVIDSVHSFVPNPAIHLATSEISTPVQKLTLDPKQELSVDPSLHGVGSSDEMLISNLVSKKSALEVFTWSSTEATDEVVFLARVSPMMFFRTSVLDGATTRALRIYDTPMSYIAQLYTHWRGDIEFEVEVLCTKFHKGRLRITWDPLGANNNVPNENEVFTTILDIGANNKATFRIPYHQAKEFLRIRKDLLEDNWTNGSTLASNADFDNGMLNIAVLTPLVSPVTPQTVGVLISVRAAENFEFANPSFLIGRNNVPASFFAVQSRDEINTAEVTVTLGDNGTQHPQRYALNFGEAVVSLRNLLHRYSIYDVSAFASSTSTNNIFWVKSFSRLPPSFGYDPNGKLEAVRSFTIGGTVPFNYNNTHPITYVSAMFGGYRGSVNYVTNFSGDLTPSIGDIRVTRQPDDTKSGERAGRIVSFFDTASPTMSSLIRYHMSGRATGTSGAALANTITNGSINWQMPHKNGCAFSYPDPTSGNTGLVADETDKECSLMEINLKQLTANTTARTTTMINYAAAGPDFHCFWFLCCPTVDYYIAYPVAP